MFLNQERQVAWRTWERTCWLLLSQTNQPPDPPLMALLVPGLLLSHRLLQQLRKLKRRSPSRTIQIHSQNLKNRLNRKWILWQITKTKVLCKTLSSLWKVLSSFHKLFLTRERMPFKFERKYIFLKPFTDVEKRLVYFFPACYFCPRMVT